MSDEYAGNAQNAYATQLQQAAMQQRMGCIGAQSAINAPTPSRPLDRIGHAADRVMGASLRVGEFLDRYHGPMPATALGQSDTIAVSYSSNLERLFGNIETLEARLQSLTEIG